MMAHLPPEVLCELGDGDFLRIGGISYRIYPLSPSTLQRRLEHRLSTRPPQGDFVGHLEDVLLNIHEAEIPGQVPSRGQFALVRIPEINFGRVWVNRPDEDSCPAAQRGGEDPVCGEETTLWNLGQGQFLANIYLNEPQRGGAFLFPRWPRPGSYRSLGELLQQCTSH